MWGLLSDSDMLPILKGYTALTGISDVVLETFAKHLDGYRANPLEFGEYPSERQSAEQMFWDYSPKEPVDCKTFYLGTWPGAEEWDERTIGRFYPVARGRVRYEPRGHATLRGIRPYV